MDCWCGSTLSVETGQIVAADGGHDLVGVLRISRPARSLHGARPALGGRLLETAGVARIGGEELGAVGDAALPVRLDAPAGGLQHFLAARHFRAGHLVDAATPRRAGLDVEN